jgi:hypothetical protein
MWTNLAIWSVDAVRARSLRLGMHRWIARSLGLMLLALVCAPAVARANISAPWHEGDPGAEPGGDLGQLEVIREQLAMDLRPLAQGASRVPVHVRYEVRNRGDAVARELVFVTPGIAGGTVLVDGKAVAGAEARTERLPAVWQEMRTPGIDGGTLEYEVPEVATVLAFPLALAAGGQHVIEVRYELAPGWYDTADLYRSHQIAYLLAPARQWGGFGTLEVRVQVPPGWEAAAQPALERQGDALVGRFQGVPADVLGVTVRHPAELTWGWVLILLGLALGLGLGVALVRRLGGLAASWRLGLALLTGLAASAVATAALFGLPVLGMLLWQALLDDTQRARHYFYDLNMAMFLLGPAVGVLYVALALVLFLRARQRARREHAA